MKTTLLILCLLLAACTGCDDGGVGSTTREFRVTIESQMQGAPAPNGTYGWEIMFRPHLVEGYNGVAIEIESSDGVTLLEWAGGEYRWVNDRQGGGSGEVRRVTYYPASAEGIELWGIISRTGNFVDSWAWLGSYPDTGRITKTDKSRAVTFVIDTTGPVVVLR